MPWESSWNRIPGKLDSVVRANKKDVKKLVNLEYCHDLALGMALEI